LISYRLRIDKESRDGRNAGAAAADGEDVTRSIRGSR